MIMLNCIFEISRLNNFIKLRWYDWDKYFLYKIKIFYYFFKYNVIKIVKMFYIKLKR